MTFTTLQILTTTLRRNVWSSIVVLMLFSVSVIGQNGTADELNVQKCWESRFKGTGGGRMATDGSTVFVVRDGSIIDAFAAENGAAAWTTDVGGEIDSNLIVENGSLFLVRRAVAANGEQSEAAVVRALSTTTGITKWSAFAGGKDGFMLRSFANGLVAISRSGVVQSFAIADGATGWKRQLNSGSEFQIAQFNGQTFLVADGKQISSLVINGSEPVMAVQSQFPITTIEPLEGKVAWGDDRGNISLSLVPSSKSEWQFKSGGSVSDIILSDGKLIASSNDNFVYAIAPYNGNRIWKRRVGGRVAALKPIGGDTLLVQPLGDENVVLLRIKDGKVVGQIQTTEDEFVTDSLVLDGSRLVVLTDRAVYGYAIGSCTASKKSGPGVTPADRSR